MESLVDRLPAELRLQILKDITDPTSLCCLLKASPCMALLFEGCYLEIILAVLPHSLHPQLLQLAFAWMNKRVRGFEGMESFVASTSPTGDLRCGPPVHPLQIGGHSSQSALALIELAGRIQHEAWATLQKLLHKTNQLRYYYASKDSLHWAPEHTVELWRRTIPWTVRQRAAEPVEYQLAKCGMPSWLEAFRIHRALWRFYLFLGHNDALLKLSLRNFWRHLKVWEIVEIETLLCAQGRKSEMGTVVDSVRGTEHPPPGLLTSMPPAQPDVSHTPCQIAHRNDRNHLRIYCYTSGSWPIRYPTHQPGAILNHIDASTLQGLGLNIWDSERLIGLGLADPMSSSEDPKRSLSLEQQFTWKMLIVENSLN